MTRTRLILAALLATTFVTPVMAQNADREGRRAERQQQRAERPQRDFGQMQQREQRREAMRAERQQQGGVVDRGQWQAQRQERRVERRVERQQAPVVQAPAPVQRDRNVQGPRGGSLPEGMWRDRNRDGVRDARNRDRDGDGIRNRIDRDRDGDGIRNRREDRDRDGVPNFRDRDRDGDGVRNNRDFDRNNNGVIDRRFDRNRNGVVDRRIDRNRDGIRDRGNWNNGRNWNRDWRNDRRYDWQGYRYGNRSLYRLPRYYSPYGYGYGYRRYGIGVTLDALFFGSRYWISDPWQYRLPAAEYPYRWVRYYNDALLVDTETGYVEDVIHDFFW